MRKTLHLICQAHLDPVWLWPVREGCAEALTTLQSAVDRATEFPSFKFTRSSAAIYRWAKEMDPALWRSIQRLVRAKRWETVGGWVEQPDCNLPSGESFLRQGLYGGEFFQRELGTNSRIGYNVDSFGHNGALPQILKVSGMDYYVFMRPMPRDGADLPLLFWWESIDGSRVLTQRVPLQYSQSYGTRAADIERYLKDAERDNFAEGFEHGVFFLGVGNHGGGPTREHLAKVCELQKDPSLPEIRFSTMQDYFDAVENSPAFRQLTTVKGELQFHSRGCYSSTGEVKRLHRFAEKSLGAAEGVEVINRAGAKTQAAQDLREAWWRLLFNQFHDILAGSCIVETLEETRHRFGATLAEASEATLRSAYSLARRVDTRSESGSVLFACNPLPWKRTALVQLDGFISPNPTEEIIGLETNAGKSVPLQWMKADAYFGPWLMPWGKLTAAVNLPAGGYRVLRVKTRPLKIAHTETSNEQFTQRLVKEKALAKSRKTKTPAVPSLKIGQARAELLAAPVGVVVMNDQSDAWGMGVTRFDHEIGRPDIVSTQLLEEGPLVSIMRQLMKWRSSEICLDVIRYAHSPHIRLHFRINWQEKRQMAKLEIPTRLTKAKLYARTAGEVIVRPANGDEYPNQDWVALEGQCDGKKITIGLINDSTYSHSAKEGTLRAVLIRSAAFAEIGYLPKKETDTFHFMDQGWQERSFWLVAGRGACARLGLDRLAQEWQVSAPSMLDSGHPGTEPWEKSVISVEPSNISVLAMKSAEDGKGVILRVQEMAGKQTKVAVRWMDKTSAFVIAPWQIKTWRITTGRAGCRIGESTAMEKPMATTKAH